MNVFVNKGSTHLSIAQDRFWFLLKHMNVKRVDSLMPFILVSLVSFRGAFFFLSNY